MTSVFVICAALGGTILVCQVLLGLLGLGGDAFHGDADGGFDADVGSTERVRGSIDLACRIIDDMQLRRGD